MTILETITDGKWIGGPGRRFQGFLIASMTSWAAHNSPARAAPPRFATADQLLHDQAEVVGGD